MRLRSGKTGSGKGAGHVVAGAIATARTPSSLAVFADVIDGPLAYIPSGSFAANSAWVLCAAIAHNLLRATGVLAGERYGRTRGATLRRRIVAAAARLPRPQRRPVLHTCPAAGRTHHAG